MSVHIIFRAEKQSREPQPSLIMSLPDDIIVDIVARVPICYYPTVSLVSKSLRSLVASPELYTRRSLLGFAEHCLYVILYNYNTKNYRFYILRRKVHSNCLVIIRSFPCMPCSASFLTVGSKIYVVDSSSSLSIVCRSHTVQPISHIPMCVYNKVAGIIDGKIYVIGDWWWKRVTVFDTETQMWEPKMIKPDMELGNTLLIEGVVIEDKIYMRDFEDSFRCWSVVKGLEKFLLKMTSSWWSQTVSYGGKLALFFCKDGDARKIWCAEIALERRQGGEILGKVQWCDVVIDDGIFRMVKCLAVTV
ncbi:hypothetical protein EUTSA_v10029470mg [Eutrema salsugineum]|uniref:F-box domain-containing protein n=1 Tax=Eutrema salsugineum TaxID=72664 RepID=V4N0X7_EUTSA|nr:hypothetical protein EUTSA_v10029470mg [Eutrema salsugineum]